MRHVVALLATMALILALVPSTVSAAPPQRDTWIVQLRDGVNPAAAAPGLAKEHGGSVGYVYRHALNGFSFRGSAAAAAALTHNPKVTLVEADAEVTLEDTQSGATWGIDRIDQRALPLSGSYTYSAPGPGVTAYIIDTGIRSTHQEFGGRASVRLRRVDGGNGTTTATATARTSPARSAARRTASRRGSRSWRCASSTAAAAARRRGVIAGIDWVIGKHAAGSRRGEHEPRRRVSSALDTADEQLIDDGVSYGRGRRQRQRRAAGAMPATTRPRAFRPR